MRLPFPVMLLVCFFVSSVTPEGFAQSFDFTIEELKTQLKVGYSVRLVDVNSDNHLDIVIVDSKRVLWLENPTWEEHVVYDTPNAAYDNVCLAAHDVNSDGRVDFALGADWQFGNSDSGGTIGWLEQTQEGPWKYRRIASEPTTHRMYWADLDNTGKPWLVVAPLKGRGTKKPAFDQRGVRLLAFQPGAEDETWNRRVLTEELHVMHNFAVSDLDRDGKTDLLTASYEGANWLTFEGSKTTVRRLGSGQELPAPKRGASEIRLGRLASGGDYLATVEPWHGDKVVIYSAPENWHDSNELWPRFVLDSQLAWGHAVACANLDEDADDELIIGVRDDQSAEHRCGLRIYDPSGDGQWSRQLVDPGGVAIEDLTTGDLDGDGDIDVVAVGRQTHNAKIYWNQLR